MSQTQESQPNELFNQFLEGVPSQERISGKSNVTPSPASSKPSSQNTFTKLEEALDSREEEIKALRKAARDTFEINEAEISSTKKTVESLQSQISDIQSQLLEANENALEASNRSEAKLEEKQAQLEELQSNLERLNEQRSKLLEENSSLQSEISKIESALSLTKEQLEMTKEDLEESLQQIEGFQTILDEKESDIQDLEDQISSIKSEQEDRNREYERKLAGADGEIKSLNRELELKRSGERKEDSNSKEESSKLISEISQLEQSNQELKVQIEIVREEMTQLSEAANRQTEDLQRTHDENQSLKSEIQELSSKLETLKKNLEEEQSKAIAVAQVVASAIPAVPSQITVQAVHEDDIVIPDDSDDRVQKSLAFSSELDYDEISAVIEDGKNDVIRSKQQDIDRLKQRAVGYHDEITELRRQLGVKQKTESEFRKEFDKAMERFRTELLFKEEEIRNLALEKYLSSEEGSSSESEVESGAEDKSPTQSPSKKDRSNKRKRLEAPALKAFEQTLNFSNPSSKKTRVVRVGRDATTIFTSAPSRITIQPQ